MKNRQRKLLDLLDRSGTGLFTLLTRLTMREDVAEELMQELFIKLSRAPALDGIDRWEAYARTAAINLAFDWHRKQKRYAVSLDRLPERTPDDNSPLGNMIRSEDLRRVISAVGGLSGTSREAFVMRYVLQQSYDYIAGELDRTPHQVRALCAKALGHLRRVLASDRAEPLQKESHDV